MPKINTKHWRQSPQNCRISNADVTQTAAKPGSRLINGKH